MSDPLFEADDEANTPLTPQGREGLIPTYITTRAELNEAEQENIAEADRWAFARKRSNVVDIDFLKSLHRRMLRRVWRWAGRQRTNELNIGVGSHQIAVQLHALISDVRYWIQNSTFPVDEIAVRFHHRLVAIHPFANGNGRHSRLATNLLVVQLGGSRFSRGRENLVEAAETRRAYVRALQAADHHDIAPLPSLAADARRRRPTFLPPEASSSLRRVRASNRAHATAQPKKERAPRSDIRRCLSKPAIIFDSGGPTSSVLAKLEGLT